MIIPKGSFVLSNREALCGIAFNVHRLYSGGALDVGAPVADWLKMLGPSIGVSNASIFGGPAIKFTPCGC